MSRCSGIEAAQKRGRQTVCLWNPHNEVCRRDGHAKAFASGLDCGIGGADLSGVPYQALR